MSLCRSIGFFSLLATTIFFTPGCGDKDEPKPAAPTADREGVAPKYSVPDNYREAVTENLSYYFKIHSALASDNFTAIEQPAESLQKAAEKVEKLDGKDLSEAARFEWMEFSKDLKTISRTLLETATSSSDLDKARKDFGKLSAVLVRGIQSFGHAYSDPVQILHCSMAFGGQGADWLQQNKKEPVHNPYFGSAMLECGTRKLLVAGTVAR